MQAILEKARTYYQDDYMKIAMAEDMPVILFKAVGLPKTSDHFKEEFNFVLDFIFKQGLVHPVLYVLGDLRDVQTLIEEDMQYLCDVFYPRVDQSNVKKIALLTPVSIFSQIALEQLYAKLKLEKVIIRIFNDQELAKQWLMEGL